MVRTRYLTLPTIATLVSAIAYSSIAHAEAPIDWYIELKREAKYARIRASGGASRSELLPSSEATARLIARVASWDKDTASSPAKQTCLVAAERLQAAFNLPTAQERHAAIIEGERDRDGCLSAIQRR